MCYGDFLRPKSCLQIQCTAYDQAPISNYERRIWLFEGLQTSWQFYQENYSMCIVTSRSRNLDVTFGYTVQKNRQRGAQKSAEIRCQWSPTETQQTSSYCGVCGLPYKLYTDDVQNWIACDGCELRFHFKCVGVITVPEVFIAHSVSLKVNFGRVWGGFSTQTVRTGCSAFDVDNHVTRILSESIVLLVN